MFTHVQILACANESDIDKTAKVLRGLGTKIDEVQSIEVGTNGDTVDRSAHIAIVARFANTDDFETFLQHAEYAKTQAYLERVNAVCVHVNYPEKNTR